MTQQCLIASGHLFAVGADALDLTEYFLQRYQGCEGGGVIRSVAIGAVGQTLHPVQHPNRDRLMTDRAESIHAQGLYRVKTLSAFAVAVKMVFALFGEKLQGAAKALTMLHGASNGEVIQIGLIEGCLAPQFGRGVGVGVGDQSVAIQAGDAPIHGRIGGEPGFDGKNVPGQIAIAVIDGIKSRLGTQGRKPRRPDMGRNQIAVGARLQGDLQQIAGIKTQYRPSIGGNIADAGQRRGETFCSLQARHADQVMHLAGFLTLFVDGGDLHRQLKAGLEAGQRRGPFGLQGLLHLLFQAGPETEQSRLRLHKMGFDLLAPCRVGKIAGAQ